MMRRMVTKVGYYSARILLDMSKYGSITKTTLWREIGQTQLSLEDRQYLAFIFTDPEVLKLRLRSITSWAELKQFSGRMKRIGRVLNREATGEYWRCYQVLEDWSFLLTELGDSMEALTELKNTKMPLADVLKVYTEQL